MAKSKAIVARNARQLAKVLGLSESHAHAWEVQVTLLSRLQKIVKAEGLTHAQVARKAGTSRTRITAILNGNIVHVSTDLLIRILGSLGYSVSVSIAKGKLAA